MEFTLLLGFPIAQVEIPLSLISQGHELADKLNQLWSVHIL